MTTREQIYQLFRKHGPMSVAEAARRLGLYTALVRHYVREPEYRRIACHKATRNWEWHWQLLPPSHSEAGSESNDRAAFAAGEPEQN